MVEPKYEQLADALCNAIIKLAANDDALDNFGGYLAYCFPAWMEQFASYPEGLVSEFQIFANMYDDDEQEERK